MFKPSHAFVFIIFTFIISYSSNCQEVNISLKDSLQNFTFDELWMHYKKAKPNLNKAKIYANAYLNKALNENDTLNIARAYKYLSVISTDSLAINYADEIIKLTKFNESFHDPARGYIIKAERLYKMGDSKRSLDNLIKGKECANRNENIKQQLQINFNIGALKNRWGLHEEALSIFEEQLSFIKKQPDFRKKFKNQYISILHNLSLSYVRNNKFNKALNIIDTGKEISLEAKDALYYYRFIMNEGTVKYFKGNYKEAIKCFNISSPYLKNTTLAMNYFYNAKSLIALDIKEEDAIVNLKRVDSLYQSMSDKFPEIRETYEILFDYYKKKNDVNTQLHYIDKLMNSDNLITDNFKYLNNTIIKKYNLPELMTKKEKLSQELQIEKKKSTNYILIFFFIIIIFIVFFIFYAKRQRKLKRNFKKLIETNELEKSKKNQLETNIFTQKNKDIGVPEKVVLEILNNLKKFEERQLFLQKNINQTKIANSFNSNSSYLSKVVNNHKNKTFANYINDLRIDYIIDKLRTDKKLRLYSLKGIADEAGFNNVVSFNKAFLKKTDLKASYFIQELNVKNN